MGLSMIVLVFIECHPSQHWIKLHLKDLTLMLPVTLTENDMSGDSKENLQAGIQVVFLFYFSFYFLAQELYTFFDFP